VVQYEESYVTATPEGLTISLPLAGPAQRMAAYFIDEVINIALSFLFFGLAFLIGSVTQSATTTEIAVAVLFIALFLLQFGYFILFEVLSNGATPGKRVVGLRVVDMNGGQVGFRRSVVRNLLRLVDGLASYAVGIVAVVVSSKNQRLGDMAAGTLVVRQRPRALAGPPAGAAYAGSWTAAPPPGAGAPGGAGWPAGGAGGPGGAGWPAPAPAPAPGGWAGTRHGWDVTGVTSDDVAVVRQFLFRRDQLPWAARQALANDLANRLWPKVAGQPAGIPPEQFLEQVTIEKLAGP
jgi:uncharacterized RDD family membrane protein YckC